MATCTHCGKTGIKTMSNHYPRYCPTTQGAAPRTRAASGKKPAKRSARAAPRRKWEALDRATRGLKNSDVPAYGTPAWERKYAALSRRAGGRGATAREEALYNRMVEDLEAGE